MNKCNELHGITIDGSQIPDIILTLVIACSFANGETVIENIQHLRYKETDRIHNIVTEIKKAGIDIKEYKDKIKIIGSTKH